MNEELIQYDGPKEFVGLHQHSRLSILDGVMAPDDVAKKAKEYGHPAFALTEHGSLGSVVDGYTAAKKYGLKFIAGNEIYLCESEKERRARHDEKINGKSWLYAIRETSKPIKAERNRLEELVKAEIASGIPRAEVEAKYEVELTDTIIKHMNTKHMQVVSARHLTVLCKNKVGLKNLTEYSTVVYDETNELCGYYRKPRMWFDGLSKYGEGLIILSGCFNGPLSHAINYGSYNSMTPDQIIKQYRDRWGDDYYIELQMPGVDKIGFRDYKIFWELNNLANKHGIKKVLATDAHYIKREDAKVQRLMMAIDQDLTINDPDLWASSSSEQFYKSRRELYHTFKTGRYSECVTDAEFENMCNNTLLVADKCENLKFDASPKIPCSDDDNVKLKRMVANGLRNRGDLHLNETKYLMDGRMVTYKEQAKIELERYISKGFASYFILTSELLNYAQSLGYPTAPRGSAGGSLIVYLLGLSELDPLGDGLGLSSNRFLSDARGGKLLDIELK